MATRLLKQYVLPSDVHKFVGRIYDLSIVGLDFDSYQDLSSHDDCKYIYDVNHVLSMLTRRVESLNMVGGMLWPSSMPDNFKQFPVSRYEWLTVCADVFLARYISVVDCSMILVSQVFECGLSFEACTAQNLKKNSIPPELLAHLMAMIDDQGELRRERNRRFHHGLERRFSSDDEVFRVASLFEHRFNGAVGPNGRALPVERLYREGLVELQRDFNTAMRKVVRQLSWLYDALHPEFDRRFSPKFNAGTFARRGAVQ